MDTTEKYIKMCKEAQEIQGSFTKKDGDFIDIILKEDIEEKIYVLSYNDNYIEFGEKNYLCYDYNDGQSGFKLIDSFVWLPRQDQLQEFIEGNLFDIILEFNKFISLQLLKLYQCLILI